MIVLISVLMLYLIIVAVFLYCKRSELKKKESVMKYGNLYPGVNLNTNRYTTWFYPMFLIRRVIFVLIPIVFAK